MPKPKDKRIQRALDYQDRQEQRILDRELTREGRELAQLEGRDPLAEKKQKIRAYFQQKLFTPGDARFLETLIATPSTLEEAQRRIDRYFQEGAGRRVQPVEYSTETLDRLKKAVLNLEEITPSLKAEFDRRYAATQDASYLISGLALALAVEGQTGPYDDTFEGGQIFWRGDDRAPSRVHATGFSSKVGRDLGVARNSSNVIIYRTGADDIVPASGVCIAKDIRGGAFFPFSKGTAYLYAIVMDRAVNTFRAQRYADRVESGNKDWKDPERFKYDPTEADSDAASTVWEYREHVAHRIEPERIIGAWALKREFLIQNEQGSGEEIKSGMRFYLASGNLWPKGWSSPEAAKQRGKAEHIAAAYKLLYPRDPGQYLSYQGIVRKVKKGSPKSASEAQEWVQQVDAIPSPLASAGPKALKKFERLEANRERRLAQWKGKESRFK